MIMRLLDHNIRIWGVLVILTLASVSFAELTNWHVAAVVAIFAVAVVKAQLVAVNFMETGHALPHWNWLYRVWIAAIGCLLCGGTILSMYR